MDAGTGERCGTDGNAHTLDSEYQRSMSANRQPMPRRAEAKFNIRFNTEHSASGLMGWLEEHFARIGGDWQVSWKANADPFVTAPGQLTELIAESCVAVTGRRPELSTSGGTSDARFITRICPVAEFGLVGQTMHQVDEHVAIADIDRLADIYEHMMRRFFGGAGA